MKKEQILSDIRRIGKQRGGHVSLDAFLVATGMKEHQLLGKYWATWNEAVAKAGLPTAHFFRARTEESSVIGAFADLVERLKKWPTQNELLLERRRDVSFPSLKVILRMKNTPLFASKLAAYCTERGNLSIAAQIATERMEAEQAEPQLRGRAPINGYVYMMQSGRRYKIGHTTSPSRRHREVRLDLPDSTTLVHAIPTDDPVGIESYWHLRFDSKRIRETEFFTLDASDVAAFKRRKYQ
jgi:hypothetical protein